MITYEINNLEVTFKTKANRGYKTENFQKELYMLLVRGNTTTKRAIEIRNFLIEQFSNTNLYINKKVFDYITSVVKTSTDNGFEIYKNMSPHKVEIIKNFILRCYNYLYEIYSTRGDIHSSDEEEIYLQNVDPERLGYYQTNKYYENTRFEDQIIRQFLLDNKLIEEFSDSRFVKNGSPYNKCKTFILKQEIIDLFKDKSNCVFIERTNYERSALICSFYGAFKSNHLTKAQLFEIATLATCKVSNSWKKIIKQRLERGKRDKKADSELHITYFQALVFNEFVKDPLTSIIKRSGKISKATGRFYYLLSFMPKEMRKQLTLISEEETCEFDISDTGNTVLYNECIFREHNAKDYVSNGYSLALYEALRTGHGKEVIALALNDTISIDEEVVDFSKVKTLEQAKKQKDIIKQINYKFGYSKFGEGSNLYFEALGKLDKNYEGYLRELRGSYRKNNQGKICSTVPIKAQSLEAEFKNTVQAYLIGSCPIHMTNHDCFRVRNCNLIDLFEAIINAAHHLNYKFVPYLKIESGNCEEINSIDFINKYRSKFSDYTLRNLEDFERYRKLLIESYKKSGKLQQSNFENYVLSQLCTAIPTLKEELTEKKNQEVLGEQYTATVECWEKLSDKLDIADKFKFSEAIKIWSKYFGTNKEKFAIDKLITIFNQCLKDEEERLKRDKEETLRKEQKAEEERIEIELLKAKRKEERRAAEEYKRQQEEKIAKLELLKKTNPEEYNIQISIDECISQLGKTIYIYIDREKVEYYIRKGMSVEQARYEYIKEQERFIKELNDLEEQKKKEQEEKLREQRERRKRHPELYSGEY